MRKVSLRRWNLKNGFSRQRRRTEDDRPRKPRKERKENEEFVLSTGEMGLL